MSAWKNHVICPACWAKRHPGGRNPVRFVDDHKPTLEPCCWCGADTGKDGIIYVREKSEDVACKGTCGEDAPSTQGARNGSL